MIRRVNLFVKPIYRAIYNYYKFSKTKVKINNYKSEEFIITVKQMDIIPPYLFHFFMNELLVEKISLK
jgi:hypothetical protein